MWIGLNVKHPLFLSNVNETRILSTDFRKKYSNNNFHEFRSVGAQLFHSDGRTDMTKLISRFPQFCERA
jgi:hypothetical protein